MMGFLSKMASPAVKTCGCVLKRKVQCAGDHVTMESTSQEGQRAAILPDDVVRMIISLLPLTLVARMAATSRFCYGVLQHRRKHLECLVEPLRGYQPRGTTPFSLLQLFWISTQVRRLCRGLSLKTGKPLESCSDLSKFTNVDRFYVMPGFLSFQLSLIQVYGGFEEVAGDGKCMAHNVSEFHYGSLVRACVRIHRAAPHRHGLSFGHLRGQSEPYLEIRPINWAWGTDDASCRLCCCCWFHQRRSWPA